MSKQFNLDTALGSSGAVQHHVSSFMMKKLHEERFTTKDTDIPYRQINYLDEQNLLTGERSDSAQWRRFSLKDLIYLKIVKEVRQYGASDEILGELQKAFYDKKSARMCDIAIFLAMTPAKIIITITSDGAVRFYDLPMKHLHQIGQRSRIEINLNQIVTDLWDKFENERLYYIDETSYITEITKQMGITKDEAKLLSLIRRTEYKTLEIVRDDGGKITKIRSEEVIKTADREILKDVPFGEIVHVKNNGKTVLTLVRRTHKI